MEDYLKIVVVGEVDSGKSTLIGRFLYEMGSLSEGAIEEIESVSRRLGGDLEFAYLLDSLEEERNNQLTIDTTEAFCKTKKGRQFIFIDVPGHKELLKNMLCGSSYADIAILVVDVQKSIEDQTRRHAFILKFLGIEQIILVLNKMDSVHFSESIFNEVKENIIEFFKKAELQSKHFIPVSAKGGEGLLKKSKKMAWYNGLPLAEALNAYTQEERNGDLRLPIQDIYTINNEIIAVGKVISGKIKRGEKVTILPLNKECNVKKVKIFNENKSIAKAPESIGLMLDEMVGLNRGQVICKPVLPKVTQEILIKLFCIHPLNIKENFRFRCTTQDTSAQIKQINRVWDTANLEPKLKYESLDRTDVAEVIMATDSPVVVESYSGSNSLGRFVLKSNGGIHAVGIIL